MNHREQVKHLWINGIISMMAVLFGVTALVFCMSQFVRGDIAEAVVLQRGLEPIPQQIELVKEELGLNDSLPVQYVRWVSKALQGDLGTSYRTGQPVWYELWIRFDKTLALAISSATVALLVTLFLGIGSITDRSGMIRRLCSVLIMVGTSIPTFVLSLGFIYLFAIRLQWVNVIYSDSLGQKILPVLTLALAILPASLKVFQTSLDEQINQLYVTVLKSRGYSLHHILYKDVLKASLAPWLTQFSMTLGHLLGGSVMVETIYGIGGIGQFMMSSILNRDYPVISGYVLIMGIIFVLLHQLVELISRVLYPYRYVLKRNRS